MRRNREGSWQSHGGEAQDSGVCYIASSLATSQEKARRGVTPIADPLDDSGIDVRLERARGDETGQFAFTSNAVEEADALRLGAERNLPARRALKGQLHQVATNTETLVRGIDEDLRYGREEVTVGQDANAADETRPVPGADVDSSLKGSGGLGRRTVTRPDALREREKVTCAKAFAVGNVVHSGIHIAI